MIQHKTESLHTLEVAKRPQLCNVVARHYLSDLDMGYFDLGTHKDGKLYAIIWDRVKILTLIEPSFRYECQLAIQSHNYITASLHSQGCSELASQKTHCAQYFKTYHQLWLFYIIYIFCFAFTFLPAWGTFLYFGTLSSIHFSKRENQNYAHWHKINKSSYLAVMVGINQSTKFPKFCPKLGVIVHRPLI